MSWIDWLVLFGTLSGIVVYGIYKTRKASSMEAYLHSNHTHKWWEIGLSVMATQASAITFLSTPGQAYTDGMGFVQFYLGLPLAMIVISVFFIPVYYKLKVYTAYEFLESRFDVRIRTLTAILFLVQRGLAAGITIYAPSIILSQLMGWNLNITILFIGVLVTLYVLTGGSKAVAITHKQQMAVIFLGMFIAFGYVLWNLREFGGLKGGLEVAGVLGKMNIVDTNWDLNNRYTLWSGLLGGLFLQLSYFGCDQSQVGRYLGGASLKESRLGLMFNGLLKIPMQFFILLTGVLVFVYYQVNPAPVFYNEQAVEQVRISEDQTWMQGMDSIWLEQQSHKPHLRQQMATDIQTVGSLSAQTRDQLIQLHNRELSIRSEVSAGIAQVDPDAADDGDYIFMWFVMQVLPIGLVGLLFAVIFSAGMSSTSSEINALAGTFSVDIYKRWIKKEGTDVHYVWVTKVLTATFGALAIFFAMIASLFDNLIEAVNIIGSLFYGTILGIFLTALLLRKVNASGVFWAAIITQIAIFYLDFSIRFNWPLPTWEVSFLWYNVLACLSVVGLSLLFSIKRMAGKQLNEH